MRFSGCGLLLALVLALGGGCKKSAPEGSGQENTDPKDAQPKGAAAPTLARVHWLGMKQVLADANAAGFKKIWDMPETARLEARALDKLAVAPWRKSIPAIQAQLTNFQAYVTNYTELVTNHPYASLLRPLLDDLVQEECYLEVRGATNAPAELALAVRLDEHRSDLWQTNLAKAMPALQFARAGAWTLIGVSPEQNTLLKEFAARIQARPAGTPFESSATNHWLELNLEPGGLLTALGIRLHRSSELPSVSCTLNGDGTNVLTRGKLHFAGTPALELEPWNVPTNLIHEPLFSFTAMRGIGPWLSSCPLWQSLQAGPGPNQVFFWALGSSPFLDFVAAPVPTASNAVNRLAERLPDLANPLLSSNRMGLLERATNGTGIVWQRAPIIHPFLETDSFEQGDIIFGGLSPNITSNSPPPAGTLAELMSQTNLVYYDREGTGARLESWLYLGQLFRIVFRRSQIPADTQVISWFKAIMPFLGQCTTVVSKTGPAELALTRTSSLGLTGLELHVLAEWLESPEFPVGFHSQFRKLPPLPPLRAGTNAPPARP